jgi:hypothetical protein
MKPLTLLFCAAIVLGACNNESKTDGTTSTPKDTMSASNTPPPPPPMPDSATRMKNWEHYSTPGEVHKLMASWNGNWDGEVSMWMSPDAPPMVSKSKTVNKMIMGGRYQQSNHSGDMMGMPFEGQATMGYDIAKKEFTSTWLDNVGTGTMITTGTWDAATKTINLKGKMVNPEAGDGREQNVREVFKIIDDNTQIMEMYCDGMDSKEFKTMEIKYTRRK